MSNVAPTNYTELKASIAQWMARSDLTGSAEGFIKLGESVLNRKLPELNAMAGAKFALSDAAPTNWLLTNFPDVYLAAVLVWSGLFTKNDADLQKWSSIFNSGIDDVQWIDARPTSKEPLVVDEALWPYRIGFNITTGE